MSIRQGKVHLELRGDHAGDRVCDGAGDAGDCIAEDTPEDRGDRSGGSAGH